jgi:hypothetical protein
MTGKLAIFAIARFSPRGTPFVPTNSREADDRYGFVVSLRSSENLLDWKLEITMVTHYSATILLIAKTM